MSSKIRLIIEPKLLRLVRLFLKNDRELFHLDVISKRAKVPIGTTFRLMKKIVDTGLVDVTIVGKTKLYRTNRRTAREFRMLK